MQSELREIIFWDGSEMGAGCHDNKSSSISESDNKRVISGFDLTLSVIQTLHFLYPSRSVGDAKDDAREAGDM